MRKTARLILGIAIIFFGCIAVYQVFGGQDFGLFYQVRYIPVLLLFALTAAGLFLDVRYYKLNRVICGFATSLTGFIFCTIVLSKNIAYNSIDNPETILRVANMGGAAKVLNFEFKKKGNFRLAASDMPGQTVYYGRYVKVGDTIRIIRSNYSNATIQLPHSGVTRGNKMYWLNFDMMLVYQP